MYKLNMFVEDEIDLFGMPVDVASTIFDLGEGWNWIGFTPQNAGPINETLATLTAETGDFIKSQIASAQYYEGAGWLGVLTVLEPTQGYMLNVVNPGILTYPNFEPNNELARTKEQKELPSVISSWEVDYHDFEFNGTLALSIDSHKDYEGDYVGVFVENECRGVAQRRYFSIDESYYYSVMVYSNIAEGEKLTFKYYNSVDDEIIDYSENLDFTANMIVGNGLNTFGLSNMAMPIPKDYSLSRAYPNPFNPVTSFSYSLPYEGMVHIAVYDITGRMVAELVNDFKPAGIHPHIWNANHLASSLYIIKMQASGFKTTQKIMLIK